MIARVALITGAAQGIGRAVAIRLAKDGLNVAINDVASKRGQIDAVVDEIRALGRQSVAVPADATSTTEVKEMVDKTVAALGGLDVMVANAGIATIGPFLETTMEDYDRIMRVNARGVFNCYQSAARQMIAQGRGGNIIGACSVAGLKGAMHCSAYSMSKFAVRGLTQAVAQELLPHNIRVNAYAPGATLTPMMTANAPPGLTEAEAFDHIKGTTSLAHVPFTTPDKIASVVSFLASPDSSFICGQTITADGGTVFN